MNRLFFLAVIVAMFTTAFIAPAESQYNIQQFGNNQDGAYGMPLINRCSVQLRDGSNNVVSGVEVTFTVAQGGGSVTESVVSTGSNGIAATRWILGNHWTHRLMARVGSQTVTFSASGRPHATGLFGRHTNAAEPEVWKKFKGETAASGTPSIPDFGYTGYKNGEEAIPHASGTVINVDDYGATPNDGQSDQSAIDSAFAAASAGSIILFSAGTYDVLMDGDSKSGLRLPRGDNIIVRGAGGEGAKLGGTTIKMHRSMGRSNQWGGFIKERWRHKGWNSRTPITGTHAVGSTSFTVEDASSFTNRRFVTVVAYDLTGDDWDKYSSRTLSAMPSGYTNIQGGLTVSETCEIESVDTSTNTITVKKPLMTEFDSNFKAYWVDYDIGIGIEHLHFEGGITSDWRHIEEPFYICIKMGGMAHSWVRHCRFTSVTTGIIYSGYSNSIIGNLFDGKYGHYHTTGSGTRNLIALLEDNTNKGMHHGVSVSGKATGTVIWGIAGNRVKGPDTHGAMPRNTLFDNYRSRGHEAHGGAPENLPHHLDGYVRWNNVIKSSSNIDYWNPGGYSLAITAPILIGYDTDGGNIYDAYTEDTNSVVTPSSLYVAQLERRLGYKPGWIDDEIEAFKEFQKIAYGGIETYTYNTRANHP